MDQGVAAERNIFLLDSWNFGNISCQSIRRVNFYQIYTVSFVLLDLPNVSFKFKVTFDVANKTSLLTVDIALKRAY